jgi:hypothetical protein
LTSLVAYRPGRPPAPGGVSVDPLGEVFIKLFPEGLRVLFAPAAALPALVDGPPVALPVVEDPVDGLPVPTLPVAGPAPAAEPPAPPACAKAKPVAKPVESAIAVASANIVFMVFPPVTWMTVTRTKSGQGEIFKKDDESAGQLASGRAASLAFSGASLGYSK